MDTVTLIMAAIALILLIVAFWQGHGLPLAGLRAAWRIVWRNLPLLVLGFVVAGLVQVLIPEELISRWLGAQAGVKGVLIGCVVGGLVPGARLKIQPYVTFPIVASLYQAGPRSLWDHLRRAAHRRAAGRGRRPAAVMRHTRLEIMICRNRFV